MTDQRASLEWRDSNQGRVPVSTMFDDPYYSLDSGLAETEHVFLCGNDLPERFINGFQIGELGFGTGLNFLATWDAWERAGAITDWHFTSFEGFPMTTDDAAAALIAFPSLADKAALMLNRWDSIMTGPTWIARGVSLHVVMGDARDTLPTYKGRMDAWYLDGFSPAKNPQMWEDGLMQAVADHTLPGGTVATYTAAGHVRRALASAGLTVARVPGFGRKRHMTRAMKAP